MANDRFYMIPEDVIRRGDLVPAAKLAFAVIVGRIGNNGHSWPGLHRIATDAGINYAAARRGVKQLVDDGLLVVDRKNGRANRYYLPKETKRT